ncbi:MAG: DUF975 family protein [Patescibacteria group bacterium]
MHSFSIGDALQFGWHKTRDHSGLLFQVVLALFALQVASAIVQKVLEDTLLGIGVSLVLAIMGVIVGAGFMVIVLKLAQGHAAHYRDLVPPATLVWYFFCATVVSGFLILLGFIALIIPGIYLALRFSMVRFAILDLPAQAGGAGITESLHRSGRLTRGHKWHLLWFFLTLAGMNIIGLLLLYVGLLVTVPVSGLAWAHVYLKLKNKA